MDQSMLPDRVTLSVCDDANASSDDGGGADSTIVDLLNEARLANDILCRIYDPTRSLVVRVTPAADLGSIGIPTDAIQ
jgi:hypothetical protein